MQVQIVFTSFGSSSQLGNFGPGDRMRCSAEHARHLVEQVRCARYADGAAPQAPAVAVQAPAPAAEPDNRAAARRPRARKEA